ncbi:MAG: hypothetical protein VX938_07940 [Myxococcota bacterium]|nr:hypothetical protein [Myxococcota bacterium]
MLVTREQVEAAQAAWGEAVAYVGAAGDWEASRERAEAVVKASYVLDGSLLFGPTKAAHIQFRHDLRGAVSYFVGRDSQYPEDKGFALEPWTDVEFENAGVVCREGYAAAMGNYYVTRPDGSRLMAEYSFVYTPDENGELLIQLHHSALPFPVSADD